MAVLRSYLLDDHFDIQSDDPAIDMAINRAIETHAESLQSRLLTLNSFDSDEEADSLFDNDEGTDERIQGLSELQEFDDDAKTESIETIFDKISKVKVEISDFADSVKVKEEMDMEIYKVTFGMQLIVPKGRIERLRFKIALGNEAIDNPTLPLLYAHDGFPKSFANTSRIISGKVKLRLNKALKIIPIYGEALSDFIDFELEPWEIHLGRIINSRIQYSGNLTASPEWLFQGDGIENELEVMLIVKKAKELEGYDASIQALWEYNPGFLRKVKMGTDKHKIFLPNQRP